jgi:hypothetical protein
MSAAEVDPPWWDRRQSVQRVGGSESFRAPRGANRTAAHAEIFFRKFDVGYAQ